MGLPQHVTGPGVVRGDKLRKVDCLQRPIGGQVRPGSIHQRISPGQLDDVGGDGVESHRV